MTSSSQLRLILAFAVIASASSADDVEAQPAPEKPSDSIESEKARALYVEGAEHFKKKDYLRAEVSFRAAYALKQHWQIALSLGDCELRNGKPRDAAEHLAFARRTLPTEESARAGALDARLKEAEARVFALRIQVAPDGADVSVDGRFVGTTPLLGPLFLDPGAHHVEIKKSGMTSQVREVDARAGAADTASFTLAASSEGGGGSGGAGGTGSGGAGGAGGAGGSEGGGGAGGHDPSDGIPKWPGFTVGGVGIIGIAVGGGLFGAAAAKASSAREIASGIAACPSTPVEGPCTELADEVGTRNDLQNGGIGAIAAGAGLLGVGIAYTIVAYATQSPGSKRAWLLVPQVTPTQQGMTLHVDF